LEEAEDMKTRVKLSWIVAVFFIYVFSAAQVWGKTFYLDGNLSADCSGSTYSIANRNCSGSDGQGYKTLQSAITNLLGGDTLYVRAGTYIRTTNNTSSGSLAISVSGTAAQPTVVSAYPGEQPVICTQAGRCQYNPNPGDTSINVCTGAGGEGGAACYYPNPAIGIGANFVTVSGFKTYGQVLIGGVHDVVVKNSDLGGGGPHINQGSVVMIDTTGTAYNITIQNNLIHNSAWGEQNANGSAVMGYNFSAIIENNEFYDNWGCDIRPKDTGNQIGRTIEIRRNFFRPSSIFPTAAGFCGINQDGNVDQINIYQNIFYNKSGAISWQSSGINPTVAYNNTFINSGVEYADFLDRPETSYNNLFYHTTAGQKFTDVQSTVPTATLIYDYNCYYSTQSTPWLNKGIIRGTTLSAWKSFSGVDTHSVSINPAFVNPTGNRPADFKRSSYAGDVPSGGPFGTVCGAYITGNEVIGVSANFSPPPPPSPGPSGLKAQ